MGGSQEEILITEAFRGVQDRSRRKERSKGKASVKQEASKKKEGYL